MVERTIWLAVLSVAVGCAPAATDGGTGRRAVAPVDAGADLLRGDASRPPPVLDGGLSECASTAVEAESTLRPVDIVWVVDSSGSMRNEAARVQENMNRFADAILDAGIDPHVVVVTSSEYVTVPPPLGDDPEHYRFVNESVGSHAPLAKLVSEFEAYADFLRPDAVTHFIAVTDDESNMGAEEFDTTMTGLLGHGYTLHAIASEDTGGGRECDGAADVGYQYLELAMRTMGLEISICTTDWTGVFTRLEEHIFATAPLPCELAIPDAPEDVAFDRERVNVQYTAGSGDEWVIPRTEGEAGCTGQGWYYDDPYSPTEIVLCPGSCMLVTDDREGRVDVTFGCESILL